MLNGNSLEVLWKVLPRVLWEIGVLQKVLPRELWDIGVLQKVLPRVLFLCRVIRKSTLGSTFWSTPMSHSTLGSTFQSTSREFPFSTPVAGRPDCKRRPIFTLYQTRESNRKGCMMLLVIRSSGKRRAGQDLISHQLRGVFPANSMHKQSSKSEQRQAPNVHTCAQRTWKAIFSGLGAS